MLFHFHISVENVSLQHVLYVCYLRTGRSVSARHFLLHLCPLHYLAKDHNTPKIDFHVSEIMKWHHEVILTVQHWTA